MPRSATMEPVPHGDEVPGRLQDPFLEGHLDDLLLASFPFRHDLERAHGLEALVELMVLHGDDAVLLRVVAGRFLVEVEQGQGTRLVEARRRRHLSASVRPPSWG